jgi:hypothetical protein
VANAALPSSGELASFSIEQLDRALSVNLRARWCSPGRSRGRWRRADAGTSSS